MQKQLWNGGVSLCSKLDLITSNLHKSSLILEKVGYASGTKEEKKCLAAEANAIVNLHRP